MMGAQHAACGAGAWVAVAADYDLPLSPITEPLVASMPWLSWLPDAVPLGFGLLDVGPAAVFMGAIICAGAALLPDIDHHNASIAHSLPPVSMILARFFNAFQAVTDEAPTRLRAFSSSVSWRGWPVFSSSQTLPRGAI